LYERGGRRPACLARTPVYHNTGRSRYPSGDDRRGLILAVLERQPSEEK